MLHKNTTIPRCMVAVQLMDLKTGVFIEGDNHKSGLDSFIHTIDNRFYIQGNYMEDFSVANDIWHRLIRLNFEHEATRDFADVVFTSEDRKFRLSIY